MRVLRLFCLSLLIPAADCFSQENKDSISVAANPKFKVSGGRTFWMGANYRKEWKTPVRVPIINLSTEKGGLTPVKLGGGKQTKSLRVEDASGREYNFRSVQKYVTTKTLPADLQSEAAVDIVADGISASYPFAALSIPILAEAAGVPYLKARLVYIPDDPKLGEHQKDFGNMLAYFEEKLPEGIKKGYDSEDVLKAMKSDNDVTIDQPALLRARILDMFVMDLDRHEGQWEWGVRDLGKGKQFFAIPKDRDQAFYINQGVLPHIAQWPWLVPQLEGFKAKAKNIERFNFAARNFDRYGLNELTEKDWQAAVGEFLPKMTDAIIEAAIAAQPPEIRPISGDKIISKLKERRNHLAGEVMEYYRFLAETVEITASNKKEVLEITRSEDGATLVQIFKMGDDGQKSDKVYERNFDPAHTKELRIYGFGGDDKFLVNGSSDKIKLRMIGGEGDDNFENTASSGKGGLVYDEKKGNNKLTGSFQNRMSNDTIVNKYDPVGFKYNQIIPFISAGFNIDDGVYLGGYLKLIRHGFRKEPYKNSHTLTLNHALATKAFNVRYNAEFIGTFGRMSDLLFEADIKSPHITNFFGYGTETIYDKSKPGRFRYYRARYRLGDISLLLRKNFSQKVIMTLGPVFQFYNMDSTDKFNKGRFIVETGENGLNPMTAFSKQSYFGGRFNLTADTRDNRILPAKGILWQTTVRYLSGLNDASYEVTQLNSDFTFHFNLFNKHLIIADRFGGGHNFGDFEFYQAQYLGSEDNLRGYRKNRFAGRSKFYNNVEARLKLANFKTYLFPGSLGILGFYDAGRIWIDDDDSDQWVSGFGGGLWISPLRRMVLTITYAVSKEDKLPLIGLGWKF
ncbi:MAG: BamA/TamA family outer membrane protein [Chitinophagaceae bacterium]|nr:BamA/TamA family outer membrane protein [Chitinophagaceae bacterium]